MSPTNDPNKPVVILLTTMEILAVQSALSRVLNGGSTKDFTAGVRAHLESAVKKFDQKTGIAED